MSGLVCAAAAILAWQPWAIADPWTLGSDLETRQEDHAALEAYSRAYQLAPEGPPAFAARAAILRLSRRIAWQQLCQRPDVVWQDLNRPISSILDEYNQVVELIQSWAVHPEVVTPRRLYAAGTLALLEAMQHRDAASRWGMSLPGEQIRRWQHEWRLRGREIHDVSQLRSEVYRVVQAVLRQYPEVPPGRIVWEFLGAAVHQVDDYSRIELDAPQPSLHGCFPGYRGLFARGPAWLAERFSCRPLVEADGGLHPPAGTLSSVPEVQMVSIQQGLGYIRLAHFDPQTPYELDRALAELQQLGLRQLILDLRGNPGGSLLPSVEVTSRFLPPGPAAMLHGTHPDYRDRVLDRPAVAAVYEGPLLLLVDRETMSAAELVACVLKQSGRATLVGQTTFGKGHVQLWFPQESHATDEFGQRRTLRWGVRLSVGEFFAPDKSPIERIGVRPHHGESHPLQQWERARAWSDAGGPRPPRN